MLDLPLPDAAAAPTPAPAASLEAEGALGPGTGGGAPAGTMAVAVAAVAEPKVCAAAATDGTAAWPGGQAKRSCSNWSFAARFGAPGVGTAEPLELTALEQPP